MNDYRILEHEIKTTLDESAPMLPPNHLLHTFEFNARRSRRLPRWLALIKEPTMRTDNHIAVGSPTVRVIAVMAATLLLALALAAAGAGAQRLLAADGPIVVAQDGSGTYETITEAVAVAEDGDEILVRPGIYAEAVVIESDIVLRGDGQAGDVVIELADEVLITLDDSNAEIADLTLRGGEFTQGMTVAGGAPTITGVVFDHTGRPFSGSACFSGREICGGVSLAIEGGEAQVLGNRFLGGGEIGIDADANAVLEDNVLQGGPHIYLASPGAGTEVRGNEISGTLARAIGVSGPGPALVTDNRISAATGIGIRVGKNSGAEGFEPTIRNNTIEATRIGIDVTRSGTPLVEGNTIHGARIGISAPQAAGTYVGNTIEGNEQGLLLSDESPTVTDNVIRGNEIGLVAYGSEATPVLTGNTICDNEVNVRLADTVPPLDLEEDNEVCEDAPAE